MLSEISQTQKNTLYNFTYEYEFPRIGKFTKTESRIEVSRGWRTERNGELSFNEGEVSVWDNEYYWWLHDIVNVLNADELYMSKL